MNPSPRLTVRRSAGNRWGLLLVPGVLVMTLFYLWPLFVMAAQSVTDPTTGVENYQRFVGSPLAVRSLVATLTMAATATVACIAVGYPYAYLMARAPGNWAAVLGAIVLIPSGVSFLIRSFALQIVLWDTGLINTALLDAGWIDRPLPLTRNAFAVVLAMSFALLPLFVLPAYSVMRRIDPDLDRAAAVLGASPVQRFIRVFLPMSVPGVAAGTLLTFVIALGYYIVPAIFGDGRTLYLGQLVVYYTQRLDWGYSSAISVVVLAGAALIVIVATRFVALRDVFGVRHEE